MGSVNGGHSTGVSFLISEVEKSAHAAVQQQIASNNGLSLAAFSKAIDDSSRNLVLQGRAGQSCNTSV